MKRKDRTKETEHMVAMRDRVEQLRKEINKLESQRDQSDNRAAREIEKNAHWRPVLERLVRWSSVICSACEEYSETCPYCATQEALTEARKLMER